MGSAYPPSSSQADVSLEREREEWKMPTKREGRRKRFREREGLEWRAREGLCGREEGTSSCWREDERDSGGGTQREGQLEV